MQSQVSFSYFYGEESEQFSYFRIPRLLVRSKKFKTPSTDAKLLYGMMLDRMGLSAKHGWYPFHALTIDKVQVTIHVHSGRTSSNSPARPDPDCDPSARESVWTQ